MSENEIAVTGDCWLGQEGLDSVLNLLRRTMQKAKSSVKMTAYSLTYNRDFLNLLQETLSREIPVTLIINRYDNDDFDGVRGTISKMIKKHDNFTVKNFDPPYDGDLHAKIIVIDHQTDNCTALVGSANLSWRAITQNHELSIVLKGNAAETVGNLVELISKKSESVNPD